MIICPNKKDPEVAREFNELVQATSELAAYHIWSLNNGNAIDKAPNGAESKLFLTLLEYYNGDRTKAIQAKAKTYGRSFLLWFGDWTHNSNTEPKVKFYAPTMGKTTAAKSNPNLIDFDDLVREDIKKLADKLGKTVREVKTESGKEYKQLLLDAINEWKNNPENIGKTLVVSNAVLAKEKIFDNDISIPSRDVFVRRLVERSEEDKSNEELTREAELYYDDLLSKWYDNPTIDNRYVSDIENSNISKVVDENGEPLVMYHVSKSKFSAFDEEKINTGLGLYEGLARGFYFTTDPDVVKNKTYNIIYAVFLNARKIADDKNFTVGEYERHTINIHTVDEFTPNCDSEIHRDMLTVGKNLYDEIVVFYPNQIKSIDNQGPTPYEGTFSRENDDIYYQENPREVAKLNEVYLYEYNTELKLLETTDFNPFDYFKNRDYAVLSEKASTKFDNYRSKVTKYRKDDKFGFPKQFFDEATGILYIKSNNYKNSRRYDAVNPKTGEVFKHGIVLFTYDEFEKLHYKISQQEQSAPKTFNPKRAINFALLRLMPSKNRYKTIAKLFIYDSIDPKETTINFEIIDRFVDSMPDALWDYISSDVYGFNEDIYLGPFYVGATDTSDINAETRKINSQHLQINLSKLGLIKLVEQITGLKLLGRKVKFNSTSKKLPNKNRRWGEEVVLDNNLTRPEIKYFIDKILHEEYFKPTSVAENIKHYAQHHNMTVELAEEVLRRNEDEYDDMYARAQNAYIRHYDWQMVEFESRIEKEWNSIVTDYLKRRYKNKFTTNDIDYITLYFSGLLPWIKISFNTDSNSGESEPFLRLFSTIHEPFHALHALTYGSDEEIALRNSYKELIKTPFGKKLHDLVKNSLTRNVDEEGLYKEICAYMFQIINTPKELIELGGDEFLSSKIYRLIKDITELPIETVDKKVTSILYSEQEKEEHIKLTFLQKLYNVIVSALHKIIPLTKQYINLINNVINVKEYVEVVTENTVTEETERSKLLQQLKKDFLTKLDEFEGAIKAMQSVDNNVLSSLYIDNFFKKSKVNLQESQMSNVTDSFGTQTSLFGDNQSIFDQLKSLGEELMKKCE